MLGLVLKEEKQNLKKNRELANQRAPYRKKPDLETHIRQVQLTMLKTMRFVGLLVCKLCEHNWISITEYCLIM